MTFKSSASGKLGLDSLEPFQMEKDVLDRQHLTLPLVYDFWAPCTLSLAPDFWASCTLSLVADFWAPCQKESGVQDMLMSAQLVMSPRNISKEQKE